MVRWWKTLIKINQNYLKKNRLFQKCTVETEYVFFSIYSRCNFLSRLQCALLYSVGNVNTLYMIQHISNVWISKQFLHQDISISFSFNVRKVAFFEWVQITRYCWSTCVYVFVCVCGGKWWCWWICLVLMSQNNFGIDELTPCLLQKSSLLIPFQLCYRHQSIRLRKNSQRPMFVVAIVVVYFSSSYMMFGHLIASMFLFEAATLKSSLRFLFSILCF